MASSAELGRLGSAMETGLWSDCVDSSIVSKLRLVEARRRQPCSKDEGCCPKGNELRAACKGDMVPFLLRAASMRKGMGNRKAFAKQTIAD